MEKKLVAFECKLEGPAFCSDSVEIGTFSSKITMCKGDQGVSAKCPYNHMLQLSEAAHLNPTWE